MAATTPSGSYTTFETLCARRRLVLQGGELDLSACRASSEYSDSRAVVRSESSFSVRDSPP